MATLVKQPSIDQDLVYEPPLRIGFGINDTTCPNPKLTMGHTFIPPNGRNQAHFHENAPAGIFMKKGTLKLFLGPKETVEEYIFEEGDFVYIEPGEIHGLINMSDSEDAELIFTYSGVPSKTAAGTVFVEPVWED